MKFRLLDLFCGAGGAAMGYHRAGFEVVGVDLQPQPHYPFEFVQGDALEYLAEHGHEYDAIHASPPCQAHTSLRAWVEAKHGDRGYVDLIPATRELLERIDRPWVIENVPGAPLRSPIMLCGIMFGLRVIRHRLFECSFPVLTPPHPPHGRTNTCRSQWGYSSFANGATHIGVYGHMFSLADARVAMGIDWMTRAEITQAIPPAYTEFIGMQLATFLHRYRYR